MRKSGLPFSQPSAGGAHASVEGSVAPAIRPRTSRALPLIAAAALAACVGRAPTAWAQEPEAPAASDAPTTTEDAAKPKPRPKKPAPPKVKQVEPKATEPKANESKATEAGKPAPARADGTLLEPGASDAKPVWPNGARSVSESYGDWTMNCNREGTQTDCVVIQSQGDRRTGRRQFSFELRAPKDERAEGLILMPFGLQIEPGVTFKLDDRTLGKGAPYSYCVADGCLVPISLPTLATDNMKTAQALTISATKPDAKEPSVISLPLAGFAAAFARAAAFGG